MHKNKTKMYSHKNNIQQKSNNCFNTKYDEKWEKKTGEKNKNKFHNSRLKRTQLVITWKENWIKFQLNGRSCQTRYKIITINPIYMLFMWHPFLKIKIDRLKLRLWEKILHANSRHNRLGIPVLISNKTGYISRYKEHLKIIKGQFIIKNLNVYASTLQIQNIRSKIWQKQKGENLQL